jgi:hypothetical protein
MAAGEDRRVLGAPRRLVFFAVGVVGAVVCRPTLKSCLRV